MFRFSFFFFIVLITKHLFLKKRKRSITISNENLWVSDETLYEYYEHLGVYNGWILGSPIVLQCCRWWLLPRLDNFYNHISSTSYVIFKLCRYWYWGMPEHDSYAKWCILKVIKENVKLNVLYHKYLHFLG